MNIKNQIRLSVLVSLILVVTISVSIIVSYQNMQDLQREEALAMDVVRGGYELVYLSSDYLINANPRTRLQWEERYASLQPVIGQLESQNPQEAGHLEIIRDYNEKVGSMFREIPEPGTLSTGGALFPPGQQQFMWSRINVQSQGMIYDTLRLRDLYNNDMTEARFWNNILVIALMVTMLAIISVNYLLISRRLERSVKEVNAGAEAFTSGNLDYRIPVTTDDEIGGIARGLNTMAGQIKSVTASWDELNREITERKRIENELRQSEDRFRTILHSMHFGMVIIDAQTHTILDANEKALEMIGGGTEGIVGSVCHRFICPAESGRCPVTDLMQTVDFSERVLLTLRGEKIPILKSVTSTTLGGRKVLIESFIDISERKQAEAQLLLKNNVFESSIAANSIANNQGIITDVNLAFLQLWGYRTAEEAIGNSVSSFFAHEEDGAHVLEALNTLGRWEGEFRAKKTDGSTFITQGIATVIRDEKGEPIGYQSTNLDITERKRAEEELKRVSHYTRSLIEANLDPLVTISPEGKITDVNEATIRATGVSRDTLIGSDFSAYFTEPDKAAAGYRKVLADGSVRDYPLTLRHTSGRTIEVLYNASVYRNAKGELQGVFAAARDITEHKLMTDELARSNRELQQFAYVSSHDLQEPLRMISSFVQLLEKRYKGKLDQDADEFIGYVVEGTSRMERMIQDLLTFSRVQSRGAEFTPVDTNQVFEKTVFSHQIMITEAGAVVTKDELPIVMGDETQLSQLFGNLIDNAVKFRRAEETPHVHISAQRRGNDWEFSVQDNGIGIDPQYFDRIFIIFQRLHSREAYEGTGIGLAICMRIVDRHGGRIWVESEPGKGSIFHFTLPAVK